MNNQVVQKENSSPAFLEESVNQELTQDLTPNTATTEENVIPVDFQAKKRLENDLALGQEKTEAAEMEAIRAQIIKIQQQVAQGREYLRSTTTQDIQTLDQPLRFKTISTTTLHAYDIFAGKAARKAAQEQVGAQTSGKTSLIDAIGKILRFGASTSEDATNQKAA